MLSADKKAAVIDLTKEVDDVEEEREEEEEEKEMTDEVVPYDIRQRLPAIRRLVKQADTTKSER